MHFKALRLQRPCNCMAGLYRAIENDWEPIAPGAVSKDAYGTIWLQADAGAYTFRLNWSPSSPDGIEYIVGGSVTLQEETRFKAIARTVEEARSVYQEYISALSK